MTEPVAVSRRIDAPAGVLFGILTDPARHPDIDGSRMVREPRSGARTLSGIGDVFILRMHNSQVGEYVMKNTVVEYEPGRRIAWTPVMTEASAPAAQAVVGVPGGHRWGYELTPDGDGCVVTEFFDASRCPGWLRELTKNGETWIPAMTATLENLERLATKG